MGKVVRNISKFFGSLLQRFGNFISICDGRLSDLGKSEESFTADRLPDTNNVRSKKMKLETEVCRKVYDHHAVLKGELGTNLVELLTRANITRDNISIIVNSVNSVIDVSSGKMAADYQRLFNTVK
jgi:hypothetical protein